MKRSGSVAEYLRAHKQRIADAWEQAVRADLEELAHLDRGALIDHLPEVLDGLAAWIEGRTDEANLAFSALADGHALQRLGFGIELPVVNIEYAWLRHVVLTHLLELPSSPALRRQLIRCNEGLDRAIHLAVRRYAEHRDYLRDRFVGILGHDLRNPLNAATLSAHMLVQSETLSERDRKLAGNIERATHRMERLIEDLLDFARGHLGGGIPASPAACDMGEICRAAAEDVQSGHPERPIEVTTRGDLRGTFDRNRVLQALGNLLANAIHHGEGPVWLAAYESEDRAAILTRVTNQGRPIAPELVPKLFDPFFHAGDERAGRLGLGLYIVGQIARAHGGTCEVASTHEQTIFTIRWPRAARAEAPGRP